MDFAPIISFLAGISTEQLVNAGITILLVILIARGVRATREIDRLYCEDLDLREQSGLPRESPILRQIRNGSFIKVLAACWFAFWNLRGLITGTQLDDWLLWIVRVGGIVFAAIVLDLPSRYLKMVRLIQDRDHVSDLREAAQDARDTAQDEREATNG